MGDIGRVLKESEKKMKGLKRRKRKAEGKMGRKLYPTWAFSTQKGGIWPLSSFAPRLGLVVDHCLKQSIFSLVPKGLS